jgi:hypothetical protein
MPRASLVSRDFYPGENYDEEENKRMMTRRKWRT